MDINNVIAKDCKVNKETVADFNEFILKNLFNELPKGSICELTRVYTTLSYLQSRYVIKIPNSRKILSIIILAYYASEDKVFKDYLKSDFAFLNEDMNKQISGVRIFDGNFNEFKQIFYKEVLPMFQ